MAKHDGQTPKKDDLIEIYDFAREKFVEATVTKEAGADGHFTYTRGGAVGSCPVSWYRDPEGWRWSQRPPR